MNPDTEAAAANEARTAQRKAERGSLADRMMAGVEHAHRRAAGQDTTDTEQRIADAYAASRERWTT